MKSNHFFARKLKRAGRLAGAVVEWQFLTPVDRKKFASLGVLTRAHYLDVRLGLEPQNKDDFFEKIEKFGFGLVKEPTDIYCLMGMRLESEPDFAFVSTVRATSTTGQMVIGFTTKTLPSGAWFYSCPFERDTRQATEWLFQTSEHIGFVPFWRDNIVR
jgi:hypothetical protein